MFTSKYLSRIVAVATILTLTFGFVSPVSAAPDNDDFANATQVGSLPFNTETSDVDAAFEADEPYPDCGYGYPLQTVWYSYTPSESTALTAKVYYDIASLTPLMGVYIGNSLNSLTQLGCSYSYYDPVTFIAQAGVTYYFQLSHLYGTQGPIDFWLEAAGPAQVEIYVDPSEPSIFDNVYFYGNSYDPAGIGGDSYLWTLWDGTTYDGWLFDHQFTADGDYPLDLTFTTYDGRTNTASTIVRVRTRDVAITKFSLPQTARTNQTKEITVEITNKRYSDYVRVTLFKGLIGGGEQEVGTLMIYVPARLNRSTLFKFSYTFTAADAAFGQVTFRAEATIEGGRDALPGDNTAIRTVLVNGSK